MYPSNSILLYIFSELQSTPHVSRTQLFFSTIQNTGPILIISSPQGVFKLELQSLHSVVTQQDLTAT